MIISGVMIILLLLLALLSAIASSVQPKRKYCPVKIETETRRDVRFIEKRFY